MLLAQLLPLIALLAAPTCALAIDTPEQAAVRKAMTATWDKPEARLEVGPIVIWKAAPSLGGRRAGEGGARCWCATGKASGM